MPLPTKKTMPSINFIDYVTLAFGPPGVGKTTLANDVGGGNVLFLSTDRGTRFIEQGTYTIPVHRWSDLLNAITELEKDPAAQARFSSYAIDHVDDAAVMCEQHVCKKMGIEHPGDAEWGKGWSALRKEFQAMTHRLLRLGKGIVFVAHEDVKDIEDGVIKVQRTQPAMSKASWKVIVPLADIVMYCGFERSTIIDPVSKLKRRIEKRMAFFQPTQQLYAKDRTGKLPAKMELSGAAIRAKFAAPKSNTPKK